MLGSPVLPFQICVTLYPYLQAISYYKIFGYPTGLGALLVRKDAAEILQKRYFGGGTVLACSADSSFVRYAVFMLAEHLAAFLHAKGMLAEENASTQCPNSELSTWLKVENNMLQKR